MKRKWIETGLELLIILLNHLLIVSVGVTAMGMFQQEDHKLWLWSLLLVIPLLFYLAKTKIRNSVLFYALHFAVLVGSIFWPMDIILKFLVILISIVYFFWSVKLGIVGRGHGEGLLGPVFMVSALGVMLLIETFYSQSGWEGIYIVIAIIYAAGYCMYLFINRYFTFLMVNESSVAYIPKKEIFQKGFCQSFMYMAGVVTLLVLTAKVDLFSGIESWLVSGIGNVSRKIFKSVFMEDVITEEMSMMRPEEQDPSYLEMLESDPGLFWDILTKISQICVALFLIGLLVFGIVKGFQKLWKEFYKDSSFNEKKMASGVDIRETCTVEKNKKAASNWFFLLDNHEKIRKIYHKQVLKHRTAIIGDLDAESLEYMTAKECCDKFTAEQLKKIYEKARYSGEKITPDDVRAAKSGGR